MKVYELRAFGLEHLRLTERPQPSIAGRRVLVRVRAASINYRDLVMVGGGYGRHTPLPLIPVSDGAGEVVAVGEEVERLAVGARVATCMFPHWTSGRPTQAKLHDALGGPLDGTLCELIAADERALVEVPAWMSYEQAASLPCAAVTAYNALTGFGSVTAGDTVLVQGTGGVALFALQFATLLGARVVVTSSDEGKLARARELGARGTVNYRTTPNWGKAVRDLTGGVGVDHVIEVGGAGTLEQSIRATAVGGQISLIGVLGGARHELHLPRVFLQQIRLQGVMVGARETVEHMLRAIDLHRLEPVLDRRRFRFEEAREALAYMEEARHFGKICISLQ